MSETDMSGGRDISGLDFSKLDQAIVGGGDVKKAAGIDAGNMAADLEDEPTGEQLDQAAQLLGGGDQADQADTQETDEQADQADQADQDEQAADVEAQEAAKIDYDQVIPLADELGEMTLGEMKDAVQDYARREQSITRRESELLNDRREHAAMTQLIAQYVPKDALEQFNQSYQRKLQQASQEVLDLIPGWRDKATFERERPMVIQFLADHGFNELYAASIVDAKQLAMYRNLAVREHRFRKVQETGKRQGVKARRKQPRRSQPVRANSKDAQMAAARNSRNMGDKAAAVHRLLNPD